jgi:hypothetical protein
VNWVVEKRGRYIWICLAISKTDPCVYITFMELCNQLFSILLVFFARNSIFFNFILLCIQLDNWKQAVLRLVQCQFMFQFQVLHRLARDWLLCTIKWWFHTAYYVSQNRGLGHMLNGTVRRIQQYLTLPRLHFI